MVVKLGKSTSEELIFIYAHQHALRFRWPTRGEHTLTVACGRELPHTHTAARIGPTMSHD